MEEGYVNGPGSLKMSLNIGDQPNGRIMPYANRENCSNYNIPSINSNQDSLVKHILKMSWTTSPTLAAKYDKLAAKHEKLQRDIRSSI